ncbi:MAG: MFS transporter [Syntrophaceae bacterium]
MNLLKADWKAPRGVFWGWYVIAGAFLILSINYGARYSFGVFVKPLCDEYGWSRSVVSLGASINMFVYSTCAIVLGRIVDRIAPRRIITVGALIACASFMLLKFVKTPLEFYIVYGLLVGVGSAGMGVVVMNSSAAKWFVKKRGTAIGIATMGVSFGTFMLTPAAGFVIKNFDWRTGFTFISLLFLASIAFAYFLMGKANPESCGLLPDGETDPEKVLRVDEKSADAGRISYGDMFSDLRFWIIGISFGLAVMTLMAAFVHQVAYVEDRGIDKLAAAASLGVVGFAGFLGQFFYGWLSDRLRDVKYSAILGMAVMMAGLIILLNMDSLISLYLYALVYGFGYGCLAPMMPIIIADRFGLRDLGPVYGMLTFFIGIGGSVGPCFAGLIYDLYGSYDLVWQSSIGILVFVGFLLSSLKRGGPRR